MSRIVGYVLVSLCVLWAVDSSSIGREIKQLASRHDATVIYQERILSRQKRWEFQTFSILENMPGPQLITTLHSSFDNDTGNVKYSIEGQGVGLTFQVNENSGDLILKHALDREVQSSYLLTVSARDSNGVEVEPSSTIKIVLQDRNDNPPIFSLASHYATVKERSRSGQLVTTITATDADDPAGPFGQLVYRLLPSDGSTKFMIIPDTGEIKITTSNLDRETADTYELVIEARDDPYEDNGRSATTTLTVSVTDVNDNGPMFIRKPYIPAISEDSDIGFVVMRVHAKDTDLRDNARNIYTILEGADSSKFSMETIGNHGVIKVAQPLDYESTKNHEYHIRIKVRNTVLSYLGTPLEDYADVVISVIDVNESPIFEKSQYTFSVSEDAKKMFPIQAVKATDPEGDTFRYFIDDTSNKFIIGPTSGMISVVGKLDRESEDQYIVTVKAGSPDRLDVAGKAEVVIQVNDVNDHPPIPLGGEKLEVVLCNNLEDKTQALKPTIEMTDLDDPDKNGPPFHFRSTNDPVYKRHFKLVDNGDSTATLHTVHNDFESYSAEEYQVPIFVQDSGKPTNNATYYVTVKVCHCSDEGKPLCDALAQVAGIQMEVLIVLLCVFVILLVLVVALITIRRRRRAREDTLIKSSISTCDDEVRENIIDYNEEGGGEEDTAAFDLSALQKDYCSSTSGSQVKIIQNYPSSSSTKVSMLTPYDFSTGKRRNVASQDVRDFIVDRKTEEDSDDLKLAYDSLQMYAYEGEGSEAGSLSSLCTSSVDEDQNYDYLQQWGPRFSRLSNIYGAGRAYFSDDESNDDALSVLSSQLGRTTLNRPRRISPC
ncbi:unnamed protein product [Clavelina lepadiformis]|uniref:Cadherin domain-containing protein n=1 Tax=Clavelina lepadiformis TaxID=159417 RepID=A0ABP0FU74_CLALP